MKLNHHSLEESVVVSSVGGRSDRIDYIAG